ncbi:hypothetical protein BC628DRAFT_859565 [Trametes gibbosa]|nr:hypothetical protein BC628DRAFT_859565 [Trametes gibbosa]
MLAFGGGRRRERAELLQSFEQGPGPGPSHKTTSSFFSPPARSSPPPPPSSSTRSSAHSLRPSSSLPPPPSLLALSPADRRSTRRLSGPSSAPFYSLPSPVSPSPPLLTNARPSVLLSHTPLSPRAICVPSTHRMSATTLPVASPTDNERNTALHAASACSPMILWLRSPRSTVPYPPECDPLMSLPRPPTIQPNLTSRRVLQEGRRHTESYSASPRSRSRLLLPVCPLFGFVLLHPVRHLPQPTPSRTTPPPPPHDLRRTQQRLRGQRQDREQPPPDEVNLSSSTG